MTEVILPPITTVSLNQDGEIPARDSPDEPQMFGREKKVLKDTSVDVFRTCADPGRKCSLKAVEIPMEHLLSGIIVLPGGRNHDGCPILKLTQPESVKEAMLLDITEEGVNDMLIYLTNVPREEARANGFCVILNGNVMADFMQVTMIKALNSFQNDTGYVNTLLYVSSSPQPDWDTMCLTPINLPFEYVKDNAGLLEYVDLSQMMPDLGGYLEYEHQDWVRFRMQVEPFLCDCVSISKRLAQAIAPFADDIEKPSSLEETKGLMKKEMKRRRTIDLLQIDQLTSQGMKINKLIKQESEERRSSIQYNPEFLSTLATVSKLISNMEAVKERVESMWSTRGEKLEATYKQQTFEKEANQIIEWFEQFTDGVAQTDTELKESQQVAETLAKEVTDFETVTQQILIRTEKVLQSGTILETLKHTDPDTISTLMGKIKQLMTDFDDRLGKRKKKIDESVQLHKLTEMSLDWCIESAGLLSDFDLLLSSDGFDPTATIASIDQFLDENPPPSAENQQMLMELAETTENHWAKQNALFAYNRVMEISERFSYHSQILENMVSRGMKGPGKQSISNGTGQGLSRIPVVNNASTGSAERVSEGENGETNTNGEHLTTDTPTFIIGDHSRSASPVFTDSDEQTDAGVSRNKSLRSVREHNKRREPKKKLHMSTELLDLDEALTFLDEVVAKSPVEKVPTKQQWKTPPSPEPQQRLSKTDISAPTRTMGPLFNGEEAPEDSEELRRLSLPSPGEDIAALTKNTKHRRRIMEELINTERVYIAQLQRVVEDYIPTMENLEEMPRAIVGKKNVIFSNIQKLLEFNRQIILPRLEQCRKIPIKLGEIFLGEEEEFLNYSKYFKNMPHQTKLMEEGGIEFFADVQRRLEDNFDLSSYLFRPFQRVSQYKLFLADMIKHSTTTDHKGKQKEYFDQLKEAHKMIDFILRHGNDMLAIESLKGFEGNLHDQGKILRQGDLVVYERHHKHKRRVFLFESTIILAKTKRPKHQPEIAGSQVYEFRSTYKTNDFTLYENIPGYPTRFELRKKKEVLVFQAETVEEKSCWTQDVWDLYFSHMLQLKDQTLEAYGSQALTSVVTSGVATLTRGRPLGHSMRRSLRFSQSSRKSASELRRRPPSQISVSSTGSNEESVILRQRAGTYSPTPSSASRLSGTFLELNKSSNRVSATSLDEYSDRSSVSSSSTLTNISLSSEVQIQPHSPVVSSPQANTKRQSQLTLEVHRADRNSKTDLRAPTPEVSILGPSSSSSSQDTTEDTTVEGASVTNAVFDTPV